jgi:iron complex transport system substrate-binding protein
MLSIRLLSWVKIPVLILLFVISSCNSPENTTNQALDEMGISYAKGFTVFVGEGFRIIEVSQAFPGAKQTYRYLILDNISIEKPEGNFDAVITLPIETVIVTSTTHIPHLDLLGATEKLVGFPNLDLISSKKTRAHIQTGKVRDLGSGAQSNIEMMIDLEPDWVMISTLGEDLKNLDILKSAGIPAVINGEYVEQHPLGRAEWIKFTGALLGKSEEADRIFKRIEKDYLDAISITQDIEPAKKPSVMAGVMYKDIWYAPGSDSWGTQLLNAAGGRYIFEDQSGTGSVQLSYEYVLDKAQDADYWLGASDFPNLKAMEAADKRYTHFDAFRKGQVYSYTSKKGPTGGIEYFELGYMRPDLILKDLIKILHPELLPDYSLYFYSRLNEE